MSWSPFKIWTFFFSLEQLPVFIRRKDLKSSERSSFHKMSGKQHDCYLYSASSFELFWGVFSWLFRLVSDCTEDHSTALFSWQSWSKASYIRACCSILFLYYKNVFATDTGRTGKRGSALLSNDWQQALKKKKSYF